MSLAQSLALPPRFSIEEEIGAGGMAVVYRGHDRHLDRAVAIKVLRAESADSLGLERFQREIGLTARLVHPGIVALFDSGEANGQLYYVMPFVAGDTLRSRLTRNGCLEPRTVATIGADIAEALAYAHGAGIVHRDVKPENVFLVEGRAVVADFGIARVAAHQVHADDRTMAGMIVGTAAYMSPEQIEGSADLDGRSDLYSLGCLLYELLAGAPPFRAPSTLALIAKHMTEAPVPLRERGVDVPPAFDAIIMRLLAKAPEERYGSAAELAPLVRAAASPAASPASPRPAVAAAASIPPATEIDRLIGEATEKLNQASASGPASVRRLEEARALIDRAAAIDAGHPRVLSALGRWYNASGHRLGTGDEMVAEGRRYLLRALAADDRDPEVHCVLAKMALYYDDDFGVAEHHARRAVELAPGDPEALRFLAIIEKILDRLPEAIDAARRAADIAPGLAAVWNGLGDALLAAGRNAEASHALERAIAIQPGYVAALERLELAQFRLGDTEFAVELRASRLRAGGAQSRADTLDAASADRGPVAARQADVAEELRGLLDQAANVDPFAHYYTSRTLADRIVQGYTELDDWAAALAWVERGFRNRPGRLRRALMDQLFDRRGFATLPRYGRLLRLAGLPELL
ncbi:MAG TPA: protein kinase, partial [Gemmatimonadaceae bacterium]